MGVSMVTYRMSNPSLGRSNSVTPRLMRRRRSALTPLVRPVDAVGVSTRFPVTDPFDTGVLEARGGHRVHWERVGNPQGKAAVVLHGGPGSGAASWWRTYFDPDRYCVTLFDQRGCGRSRPLASEPDADLSRVTTQYLIDDIEALRRLHGVERWLVLGGSWGSTLALAYAVEHPDRVSELVLWGVTTTTRDEVDWMTWCMGEVYPEAFADLRALVPDLVRGDNLPAAYHRLLMGPDAALRDRAARAWCGWEERLATLNGPPEPSPRYADEAFRLGFARLVTHFFGRHAFLPPDGISGRLGRIVDVPAVLVRGRLDIASPLGVAWRLARELPLATLHVVEADGHAGVGASYDLVVEATSRFAR
jgi:proline iminopeptidase